MKSQLFLTRPPLFVAPAANHLCVQHKTYLSSLRACERYSAPRHAALSAAVFSIPSSSLREALLCHILHLVSLVFPHRKKQDRVVWRCQLTTFLLRMNEGSSTRVRWLLFPLDAPSSEHQAQLQIARVPVPQMLQSPRARAVSPPSSLSSLPRLPSSTFVVELWRG